MIFIFIGTIVWAQVPVWPIIIRSGPWKLGKLVEIGTHLVSGTAPVYHRRQSALNSTLNHSHIDEHYNWPYCNSIVIVVISVFFFNVFAYSNQMPPINHHVPTPEFSAFRFNVILYVNTVNRQFIRCSTMNSCNIVNRQYLLNVTLWSDIDCRVAVTHHLHLLFKNRYSMELSWNSNVWCRGNYHVLRTHCFRLHGNIQLKFASEFCHHSIGKSIWIIYEDKSQFWLFFPQHLIIYLHIYTYFKYYR